MQCASEDTRFEEAAATRDLISTVEEMEEKQKIAAAEGENIDILAYYAEPPLVAANLFHLRNGRIVDRREYFWEDLLEFQPSEFSASLLMQIYLEQPYIPNRIHVPVDFEDREVLEEMLTEKKGRKVEIQTPQRGQKKALMDLVETNAKHAFHQRFRVRNRSKTCWACLSRPSGSSALTSRTSRGPTKWPAWWFGKTAA
jgi:excinuclease ABC subunit C